MERELDLLLKNNKRNRKSVCVWESVWAWGRGGRKRVQSVGETREEREKKSGERKSKRKKEIIKNKTPYFLNLPKQHTF